MKKILLSFIIAFCPFLMKAQTNIIIDNQTSCSCIFIIMAHDANYPNACDLRSNIIGLSGGTSTSFTDPSAVASGPGWNGIGSYTLSTPWDWDALWVSFYASATPSVFVGQPVTCGGGVTSTTVNSPCGTVNVDWIYNGIGDVVVKFY